MSLPNHLIVNPKEGYGMQSLHEERIEITLSDDLLDKIDTVREYLGTNSREEFIVAAANRLVNQFMGLWWSGDPYREQDRELCIDEDILEG